MQNLKEKIKNAYMLFYDRIVPFKDNSEEIKKNSNHNEKEKMKVLEESGNNSYIKEEINSYMIDEIFQSNLRFYCYKNVFSVEYFNFVFEFVSNRNYSENFDTISLPFKYAKSSEKYYDSEILKFAFIFLITVIIRSREKYMILQFFDFLKKEILKNYVICKWILYSLTSEEILIELFFECPHLVRIINKN